MSSKQTPLSERLQSSLQKHSHYDYFEGKNDFSGQCMEMCSARERIEREKTRRLHPFEVLQGTENTKWPKADPLLAIKEYSRPAAGKQEVNTSELRPPHILIQTVQHLVCKVMTRTDHPWTKIYNFVFDRLRAVRQDLVIQRAVGWECTQILEHCVCFHIYSAYRLCRAPVSEFEPKINMDHARECLKRLLVIYQLQDCKQSDAQHRARVQMEALYIMFNLGSLDAMMHSLSLPRNIQQSPNVKRAQSVSSAYLEGNFIRIKKLATGLNAIEMCCLHIHLREIQCRALKTMTMAYSSRNLRFPTPRLANWLMFDSTQEAEDFCRHYRLDVADGKVQFSKGALKEDQRAPQASFWETYAGCKLEVLTIPEVIQGSVR
ncbi:SAC3 domain-containing protein 1-like [Diadema setosum]|uniref:SAC3 domain-containing protein 1-like n=1 Tax=Diadema setosum TaxID=31175 RepID=UPI003B3AA4F0